MNAHSVLPYRIITLCGLFVAGDLPAEDISYTQVIHQAGASGGGTINLQQFNPALGQLQSIAVRIDFATTLTGTATARNNGEQSDSVSAEIRATVQLQADGGIAELPLNGFSTFSVEPGMTETEPITATSSGGSSFVTVLPGEAWLGDGSLSLIWQLVGLTTSVLGSTSTGDITVESLTLSATVVYTFSPLNPLTFDANDQMFHYVETDEPVQIEFLPTLVESGAWTNYYDGAIPVSGRVVRLPLQGTMGFYRVRPTSVSAP